MPAYASNVAEIPRLRFRQQVFDGNRTAVQQMVHLVNETHITSDAIVYMDAREKCIACGLANHLDLPCLLLGSGIRELVAGKDVLLGVDALDQLDRLAEAVDWLMTFRVRSIVVAAPTGHRHAIDPLARVVDRIVCPNIRCSWDFRAADAYRPAQREATVELPASAVTRTHAG